MQNFRVINNGQECAEALEHYANRAVVELGGKVLEISSKVDRPTNHADWNVLCVARFAVPQSKFPEFLFLSACETDCADESDKDYTPDYLLQNPRRILPEGLVAGFSEIYLTGDEACWLLNCLDPQSEGRE